MRLTVIIQTDKTKINLKMSETYLKLIIEVANLKLITTKVKNLKLKIYSKTLLRYFNIF